MTPSPRLHAVIESPLEAPAFVGPLRPRPWPRFIRLCGETSDDDVGLVVAQLAIYGHGGTARTDFGALIGGFPRVAPGGLAAIDERQQIAPSCCSGLEGWREWHQLLTTPDQSPWMGHDPAPWIERSAADFLVWPDGGLSDAVGPSAAAMQPIRFTRDQVAVALAEVERDLTEFVGRLREWAVSRAPGHAEALAECFAELVSLARNRGLAVARIFGRDDA